MDADTTPSTRTAASFRERAVAVGSWVRTAEASIRRRAFPAALVTTGVLFALFWWRLTPTFNTNDDVHTMWIADGTFFHEPAEHLNITNVLIGRLMTFLYGLAPGINWYPYYLYAIHIVAFATITWVVLSDRRFRLFIHGPALAGFFVLFYFWAWMNLQFTSASLLLGVGALLLFATKAPLERIPVWLMVAGGAMLGLVSWIRMESFQGVAALSVPILAVTVRRVPWRRLMIFGGVVGIAFCFAVAFENLYYAGQEDWQAYREFNQVRGDLHATPRVEGLAARSDLLNEIGWSRNDVTMFRFWFFMDPDVYSTDALTTVRAGVRGQTNDLGDGIAEIRADKWTLPRLLFLGGLFVFAMVDGGWRRRALAVFTAGWVTALGAYLILTLRWPDRVNVPMIAFVGLVFLLVPVEADRKVPRRERTAPFRALRAAGIGVLLLTVLLAAPRGLRWHRDASGDNVDKLLALDVVVNGLHARDPDGVFVTEGPALRSQRLAVKHKTEIPLHMVHLGWQARSPAHTAHMAAHGITDVYEAIALREDVYFVAQTGNTPADLYETYMKEHYGWSGQLRPAGRFGFGQETAAYDLLVDYSYDEGGTVLVESLPDGRQRRIPVTDAVGAGALTAVPEPGTAGDLDGWAVDIATGRDAEYIVVMHGDALGHMFVTSQARREIATGLGLEQPNQRIGFGLRYTGSQPAPAGLRVFAVFGDGALELFPDTQA